LENKRRGLVNRNSAGTCRWIGNLAGVQSQCAQMIDWVAHKLGAKMASYRQESSAEATFLAGSFGPPPDNTINVGFGAPTPERLYITASPCLARGLSLCGTENGRGRPMNCPGRAVAGYSVAGSQEARNGSRRLDDSSSGNIAADSTHQKQA